MPIPSCRVIARHERRGRRYYAGVLALLDHDESGGQTLDAPILIRTAEITPDAMLRVPVGATLVRHSTPAGEVAETHTKAAGLLSALGDVIDGQDPMAEERARTRVRFHQYLDDQSTVRLLDGLGLGLGSGAPS